MSATDQVLNVDKRRILSHLAVLLPANKRRVAGAAILAAAGVYAATQFAKNGKSNGSKRDRSRDALAAAGGNKKASGTGARTGKRRQSGQALKELLPLLLKVAGRKVIVIALLAIARTALSNRLARLQGYLFRAAFLRRVPLFTRNLLENVALCAVAAGLEATTRSWVSYMELQWRRLLTSRLHTAYFDEMVSSLIRESISKLLHIDAAVEMLCTLWFSNV